MKRTTDIDRFFKSNIDSVEVSFNENHWNKLNDALLSAGVSATHLTKPVKKALLIKKVLIISIISTLVISVLLYLLFPKKAVHKAPGPPDVKTELKMDTIISTPESMVSPGVTYPITAEGLDTSKLKKSITTDSLSLKKVPKTLKDSLEEDHFIFW